MSYICLLASQKGAVTASDSRETNTRSHRYKDKRQKTFVSNEKKAIWCCCGATRIGRLLYYTDCMRKTDRILQNDSISFSDRLTQFEEMIKKETSPLWFAPKNTHTFTILFAALVKDEEPLIGTITAKNGIITDRRFFKPPVMLDAGRNAALLSPKARFKPNAADSVALLSRRALVRVREAVRYDAMRRKKESAYVATVGGKVQLERLPFS